MKELLFYLWRKIYFIIYDVNDFAIRTEILVWASALFLPAGRARRTEATTSYNTDHYLP